MRNSLLQKLHDNGTFIQCPRWAVSVKSERGYQPFRRHFQQVLRFLIGVHFVCMKKTSPSGGPRRNFMLLTILNIVGHEKMPSHRITQDGPCMKCPCIQKLPRHAEQRDKSSCRRALYLLHLCAATLWRGQDLYIGYDTVDLYHCHWWQTWWLQAEKQPVIISDVIKVPIHPFHARTSHRRQLQSLPYQFV